MMRDFRIRKSERTEFMTTQIINEKVGGLLLSGMSRSQIAKELGMSSRTLTNRINGTAKWEFEEVLKLSRLAGCSLDSLVDSES